jgi:uncharacterized circularly permuted ATP-grasp superfamily protein
MASGWTRSYRPEPDAPDEAFSAEDEPRPLYEPLLGALAGHDPERLIGRIGERLERGRVTFGSPSELFRLDPVPRLIEAAEWERLEAGLAQRARALDAFAADAYGERTIFASRGVPERIVEGSPVYEPRMRDVPRPDGRWVHVCGFDVARRADGELVVLEDNARTPSGVYYALAARHAIADEVAVPGIDPCPIDPAIEQLAAAFRGASPTEGNGRIAVLSDGPENVAFFEHRAIAEAVGATLVTAAELESGQGRLWLRDERDREPIDVVYRRTDDTRLTDDDGVLTPLGELLFEPLRSGTLGMVNRFGSGVVDDKLSYAYTPAMIRFYLDEEPIVDSIRTYDLAVEAEREEALERMDELVLKPRFGSGGEQVVIGGEADREDLGDARDRIRERPEDFVAQEQISLSTHPCVCEGRLEPRRIDLRPFACASEDGYEISPGGLTRYAAQRGELIVNSSQGGGAKDTWVLSPR